MGKLYIEEQIDAASAVSILAYLGQKGISTTLKNNRALVAGIDGLNITPDGRKWYDFYSQKGGGIIQFVQWYQKISWKDAVAELLGKPMGQSILPLQDRRGIQTEKKLFELPQKGNTYRHIFAYLVKTRGIDPKIVAAFVETHRLYEDDHHNCVFICRDPGGRAVGAFKRSSQDFKIYKGMVAGSSEDYGFSQEGKGTTLRVFESPIDLMSYMTLKKQRNLKDGADHFLALNGLKHTPLIAYLRNYPSLREIVYAVDNDPINIALGRRPGKYFIEQSQGIIRSTFPDRYFHFETEQSRGKDWNEDLTAQRAGRDLGPKPHSPAVATR